MINYVDSSTNVIPNINSVITRAQHGQKKLQNFSKSWGLHPEFKKWKYLNIHLIQESWFTGKKEDISSRFKNSVIKPLKRFCGIKNGKDPNSNKATTIPI